VTRAGRNVPADLLQGLSLKVLIDGRGVFASSGRAVRV